MITICAQLSKKYHSDYCETRKGRHSYNDRQQLVFANFGLTVRKKKKNYAQILASFKIWIGLNGDLDLAFHAKADPDPGFHMNQN